MDGISGISTTAPNIAQFAFYRNLEMQTKGTYPYMNQYMNQVQGSSIAATTPSQALIAGATPLSNTLRDAPSMSGNHQLNVMA